ncbi:zinc-binding dehydrogenase [Filimonas lacunae]|nr:zinc-binding dehydrogenase [Filimonas lacunae]
MLDVKDVPQPGSPVKGHLVVKMQAMGVNGGDVLDISGAMPQGFFPKSRHNIAGVSGVGTVVETGEGVPDGYKGKNVTVYRSLLFSDDIIGTWSEYVQLHYLHCVILPDTVNPRDYAGSLVNNITAFAFLQQVKAEGHKGIIATAANSATGLSMLGVCQAYGVPLIMLARNEVAREELKSLGAKHVLVQNSPGYQQNLQQAAQELQTTAVFDGVGGAALNSVMEVLPAGTSVYSYGYLGGGEPLNFHTRVLMKGITLKGFSNFRTATVKEPLLLEQALSELGKIIGNPHFATKAGMQFRFSQIEEAFAFATSGKGKAILIP